MSVLALLERSRRDPVETLAKLRALPPSLEPLYDMMYQSIEELEASQSLAVKTALALVAHGRVGVTLRAAVEAVLTDASSDNIESLGRSLLDDSLTFVVIESKSAHLKFSHASVLEYFLRHSQFRAESGHTQIATICVDHIRRIVEAVDLQDQFRESYMIPTGFFDYAICNFVWHATQTTPLEAGYMQLLDLINAAQKSCGSMDDVAMLLTEFASGLGSGWRADRMTSSNGSVLGTSQDVLLSYEYGMWTPSFMSHLGRLSWQALNSAIHSLLSVSNMSRGSAGRSRTSGSRASGSTQRKISLRYNLLDAASFGKDRSESCDIRANLVSTHSDPCNVLFAIARWGLVSLLDHIDSTDAFHWSQCNLKGQPPLVVALQNQTEGFSHLLKHCPAAALHSTTISRKSPLHIACELGDVEAVQELLDRGADPNAVDDAGLPPLHTAIERFRVQLVGDTWQIGELLVKHGARIDQDTSFNAEAVWVAVAGRCRDRSMSEHTVAMLETLLTEPSITTLLIHFTFRGYNLIHVAVLYRNDRVAQLLAQHGANVDASFPDCDGQNTLHIAAHEGSQDVFKTLLASTQNPFARDDFGRTPLHCIGNVDALIAMNSFGFASGLNSSRDIDDLGRSPLHAIVARGATSVIRQLSSDEFHDSVDLHPWNPVTTLRAISAQNAKKEAYCEAEDALFLPYIISRAMSLSLVSCEVYVCVSIKADRPLEYKSQRKERLGIRPESPIGVDLSLTSDNLCSTSPAHGQGPPHLILERVMEVEKVIGERNIERDDACDAARDKRKRSDQVENTWSSLPIMRHAEEAYKTFRGALVLSSLVAGTVSLPHLVVPEILKDYGAIYSQMLEQLDRPMMEIPVDSFTEDSDGGQENSMPLDDRHASSSKLRRRLKRRFKAFWQTSRISKTMYEVRGLTDSLSSLNVKDVNVQRAA